MKIELVNTIDINEEFEKYYYTTKEKNKVNRREFLKFCTIGSAGVLLPMSMTNESHAFWPLLIRAIIPSLIAGATAYASNSSTTGDVYLANDRSINVKGDLNLALINEWDYDEFSSKHTSYTVPARKVQQYRFINGPTARVSSDTKAYLRARSRIDETRSDSIIIRA